jgi:ribonuclease D
MRAGPQELRPLSVQGKLTVPDKDAIAAMPEFDRLDASHIHLVATAAQADVAWQALQGERVLGFDTESKPTFVRDETSDGPHIVQLATAQAGYVFQLTDPGCRARVAQLLQAPQIVKAGFGLGDDKKRILHKLGVLPQGVLDLNHVFHARGWRKDMGVKGAVAVLFERRFIKSKKVATSNWAQPKLSLAQLIYAANDAYGALRAYQALGLD